VPMYRRHPIGPFTGVPFPRRPGGIGPAAIISSGLMRMCADVSAPPHRPFTGVPFLADLGPHQRIAAGASKKVLDGQGG
jgi:hypothetical protein